MVKKASAPNPPATGQPGLRLMGPPAILLGDQPVRGLPKKLEALLYLLAISGREWSRPDVAELLWDDRGGAGRQNLRVVLTKLPKALDSLLLRSGDQLGLAQLTSDLHFWRDRCVALHAITETGTIEELEEALNAFAAWPGQLLDGWEIDAPAFDDWCYGERQRVHREWQSALLQAVERLATQGGWTGIESALGRLLEVDPASESGHRWLIQCFMATGRPDDARSQYELCKRAMATLVGAKPDPSLQALLHAPAATASVTPAAPAETQSSWHGSARQDNLPRQVNSFIGRASAMNDVRRLLEDYRLVTLFGAGGIGKTRLATQVGTSLIDQYQDGVWLVDLTAANLPEAVPPVMAQALSIAEEPGRPIIEAIERRLRDRHLLVILDNCEHVIDGAADLAHRILQASPRSAVLATSREWLHIAGEATFDVPTLDLPEITGDEPVRALDAIDAIRLFVDRARAARSDFRLGEANAAAVINICRRLEGIPLALELAAARVRTLSVGRIVEALDNRFNLPGSGDRNRQPRQQTLEALIDWSYLLLDADEATVFRRLAIFAHGWTPEAAEVVAADDDIPAGRVAELLGKLVEKSLVVLDAESGRYRMLETIRHFGRDRLDSSGEADALRRRHVDYFLALAETARPHLAGPDQAEWLTRLDGDRENLLAAFARSAKFDDSADLGARFVHALRPYLHRCGLITTGLKVIVEVLSRPGMEVRNERRCQTLFGAGLICNFASQWTGALRYLTESLEIARDIDDLAWQASVLQQLGWTCSEQGDLVAARAFLEEGVSLADRVADRREQMGAYNALAQCMRLERDMAVAKSRLDQALIIARELGDQESIGCLLLNLAMLMIEDDEVEMSVELLREACAIAIGSGSKPIGISVMEVCAGLAAARRNWPFAAQIIGAVEKQATLAGLKRDAADEAFLAPLMAATRNAITTADFVAAAAKGSELSYSDALGWASAWVESLPIVDCRIQRL